MKNGGIIQGNHKEILEKHFSNFNPRIQSYLYRLRRLGIQSFLTRGTQQTGQFQREKECREFFRKNVEDL